MSFPLHLAEPGRGEVATTAVFFEQGLRARFK